MLVATCAKSRDVESVPEPLASALENAGSALAASQAIATSELGNCESLRRSFVALQKRDWEGVVLRGLVEEIVHRGKNLCEASELAAWSPGSASSLARSLLTGDENLALLALRDAPLEAVILRRRAEILFATGKAVQARELLIDSLSLEDDKETRAQAARLLRLAGELERSFQLVANESGHALVMERVATLSALGQVDAVAAEIARAETHRGPELAAAAVAAAADVKALGAARGASARLLFAVATAEGLPRSESAVFLRKAALLAPKDSEVLQALAEVEELEGNLAHAVAAWDRAAVVSPGALRPVLVPIRVLRESGLGLEASKRAHSLAMKARSEKNADALHLASQAYRYAGKMVEAVRLAEEAVELRPGEGRLQSELAARLVEAGELSRASALLAKLLVCGSRGRPWHRHEVASRLAIIVGTDNVAMAAKNVACAAVEEDDLASFLK